MFERTYVRKESSQQTRSASSIWTSTAANDAAEGTGGHPLMAFNGQLEEAHGSQKN